MRFMECVVLAVLIGLANALPLKTPASAVGGDSGSVKPAGMMEEEEEEEYEEQPEIPLRMLLALTIAASLAILSALVGCTCFLLNKFYRNEESRLDRLIKMLEGEDLEAVVVDTPPADKPDPGELQSVVVDEPPSRPFWQRLFNVDPGEVVSDMAEKLRTPRPGQSRDKEKEEDEEDVSDAGEGTSGGGTHHTDHHERMQKRKQKFDKFKSKKLEQTKEKAEKLKKVMEKKKAAVQQMAKEKAPKVKALGKQLREKAKKENLAKMKQAARKKLQQQKKSILLKTAKPQKSRLSGFFSRKKSAPSAPARGFFGKRRGKFW